MQRVHSLIRPPRATFRFTHIHGMRWQDVADEPTFGERWAAIQPLLQGAAFLAAHNASFDKGVLYACCDLYGMARPLQPFVCTVQLARKTWNLRPTKLPHVCEYLGLELYQIKLQTLQILCPYPQPFSPRRREQDSKFLARRARD